MSFDNVVVQKFGGTCLPTPDRIQAVARRIERTWSRGNRPVVVVSAMGRTTDALAALAGAVAPAMRSRRRREMDAVLATGEQLAAALVALGLEERGVAAKSLTGISAGIQTDGRHGGARIRAVHLDSVRSALRANRVPVIAGFQGAGSRGDVATLGRGGSDTTAVAVAVALGAERCDIYTDVDGVYSADPHKVEGARRHHRLGHRAALRLASAGAAVLHSRGVALAERHRMPLRVLSLPGDTENDGTLIGGKRANMEAPRIIGITARNETGRMILESAGRHPSAPHMLAALAAADIEVDSLSETRMADKRRVSIHVPVGAAAETRRIIESVAAPPTRIAFETTTARVSVIGSGLSTYGTALAAALASLTRNGIDPDHVAVSDLALEISITADQADDAVRILHRMLIEKADPAGSWA